MQTLSTCSWKRDLFQASLSELQFRFTSLSSPVVCFTRSANLRCVVPFNVRISGHSNFKLFYVFRKRNASCSMRWALEEQSTDRNNVAVDDDESCEPCNTTSQGNLGNVASISSESINKDNDSVSGNTVEEEVEERKRIDVRGLVKRMKNAVTVEDVERVLKDEGNLPSQVFAAIVRGFGREMKLGPAFAIVDWLKKKHSDDEYFDGPNLYIYNSLLSAVKQCGEFDRVEVIMSEIQNAGFSPNIITYNILMGICLDQGRAAEALGLFEGLRHKGISPSPSSYCSALSAYRKMEDGIGALNFFVDVREKYMKQELQNDDDVEDWETEFLKIKDFMYRICYQLMRRWLDKNGNFSTNVLKLLIEMDKAGMSPDRTEYEKLILACTRKEHYLVAKELYNRIRDGYSDVSLSVCNHIIWLMGKAKKCWAALEIYEDLLEKGPKPDSLSYELIRTHFYILLNAAKQRGFWKWGLRLLEKMEAKGLKLGSREWNAVLIACSKASQTTAAVEIFKKMVESGEKPIDISYGALLSALEKEKLYDEAVRVWEHMHKVGVKRNPYSFTIMASVYVGLGKFQLVDYIIKEMVSTGNNPTVVTFNAIVTVCARNGFGATAYEWFERMKAMSIEPNEVTYDMLIEALTKDGKPRLAYDLYLRALNEGLSLPARAYDAVIQSSQTFGAAINADALGPKPSSKHKK